MYQLLDLLLEVGSNAGLSHVSLRIPDESCQTQTKTSTSTSTTSSNSSRYNLIITRLTSPLTVGPRIQERGDRRQKKGKSRQEGKYRRLKTGESRQGIGERK